MSTRLITCVLASEQDVVHARQRARSIADQLGLTQRDQICIATAVSEIARNAFRYATGGRVRFSVQEQPRQLLIDISDQGPGIRDLTAVLSGSYASRTGMGMGIIGAQRLMDEFAIDSGPGGTRVRMSKSLSPNFDFATLPRLAERLASLGPGDVSLESQHQNQELLQALAELQDRQRDLERLNEELEETNRGVVALYAELDARAAELRRVSERKSRFLSQICHELRSPLNAILALTDLLAGHEAEFLTPDQGRQVAYIRSAASGLQTMVNELLDVARIEAGKVELRPEHRTTGSFFTDLRQLMQPMVPPGVELRFTGSTGTRIYTDPDKLTQVLRNYLSNALKFTESGSVTVCCQELPGERLRFAVQDTGIGIPQAEQAELFTEFYQVRNPLQVRHKGSGLGLARCKALAELMGGGVGCNSQPGSGSRFWIELPRILPLSGSPTDAIPTAHPALLPVVVLTATPAGDELCPGLEQEGLQILPVTTTESARELVLIRHPLALVLDLTVAGARELLQYCQATPPLSGLPVIVIASGQDAQRAAELGAHTVIPGPAVEVLRPPLRKLLARPRVLVIDDDPTVRTNLRLAIRETELVPLEAEDLGNGWSLLVEHRPQLLILDLVLPDGDGAELLARCRNDPDLRHQRIVIFSSQRLDQAQQQRLVSAEAMLSKDPDGEARLYDLIRNLRVGGRKR